MPVVTLKSPRRKTIPRSSPQEPVRPDWIKIAADLGAEFKKTAVERERANRLPIEETKLLRATGLVNLLIPQKFGGGGGTVREAARVIIELCKGDASVGSLLGYHFINSSIPRLFDFKGEAEAIERKSAQNRWLWGNVSQPMEKNFRADPAPGGGFIINGVKAWNTGPSLGDVTSVLAPRTDKKEILFAVVPSRRKGITYHNDWDHLGLRLTDTVTMTFENVEVQPDEVIHSTHNVPQVSFPPFYGFGSLIFGSYYIGSALGAFESARDYTLSKTRPRPGSPSATSDPYILAEYGEFWIKLQSILALVDEAAEEFQHGWDNRHQLSFEEISALQIRTTTVRAYAAQIGLEIATKIYDVTGARATANSYGFDRYWRDIRAHSLHDPIVNSVKNIGDYVLNGTVRSHPSFVS